MIYKSKHSQNFTVIPNEIFGLTKDGLAIGIFAYLLSRPTDWITYKTQLYKHFKQGRTRIDQAFNELEELGFICGIQKVSDKGQFIGFEWVVYDYQFDKNRKSENRLSENRQSENEQLISKDNTKDNILINKEDLEFDFNLTQSNKKEKIEKKKSSEQKRKKFEPPTKEEVIKYFDEKGYSKEQGLTAFNYYDVADWKDARGNKVVNWKQKMIAVWFKPEHKKKSSGNEGGTFDINDY